MESSVSQKECSIAELAFYLYYHPSKYTAEERKMAQAMVNSVNAANTANSFESIVVATLNFFTINGFAVTIQALEVLDLPSTEQNIEIPNNWRLALVVSQQFQSGLYFLKCQEQTFSLSLTFNAISSELFFGLTHLTSKRTFTTLLRPSDQDMFHNPEKALVYAVFLIDTLQKAFNNPIDKAFRNEAPSSRGTPKFKG